MRALRIIDSHCHLDDKIYHSVLSQVLNHAEKNNVLAMLAIGINFKSSQACIELAQTNPNVFATVGLHPHDAKEWRAGDYARLCELAQDPNVYAIGECGLDFNRMFSPQETQENVFSEHLRCASELGLPVVLHERDSRGRLLTMLRSFYNSTKARGVVHCFSGNREELAGYLELGLHIGITGIITMDARGRELRELIGGIPANRLLVETDAPYLTPAPERNKHKHNEPAFTRSVLLKIAAGCGYDAENLSEIIWRNTVDLFGLPLK